MTDWIVSVLFFVVLFIGYMLPTFVAGFRDHHNRVAIMLTNILFGWSVIGWGIAMIWACTASRNPKPDWNEIYERERAPKQKDLTPPAS
jgi:hypothetical protein